MKSIEEFQEACRIKRLETPLKERLEKCCGMISDMCKEGRPPRMSIPVKWNDEDVFIIDTIKDALEIMEATHVVIRKGFVTTYDEMVEARKAFERAKVIPTFEVDSERIEEVNGPCKNGFG